MPPYEADYFSLRLSLGALVLRTIFLSLWPTDILGLSKLLVEVTLLLVLWFCMCNRAGFIECLERVVAVTWMCGKSNPMALLNLVSTYFLVLVLADADSYAVALSAVAVNTFTTFRSIYIEKQSKKQAEAQTGLTNAQGVYCAILAALACLLLILPLASLSPLEKEMHLLIFLLCISSTVFLARLLYAEYQYRLSPSPSADRDKE